MKAYLKERDLWWAFSEPLHLLKCEGNKVFKSAFGDFSWAEILSLEADPLLKLQKWWENFLQEYNGPAYLTGYLGYDLTHWLTLKLPDQKSRLTHFPDFYFVVYRLRESSPEPPLTGRTSSLPAYEVRSLIDDPTYAGRIEALIEKIKEGWVYEANLSRPWQIDLAGPVSPLTLFQHTLAQNPSPYAGYFEADKGNTIISASPECLLIKRGLNISTFPIKGTRPVAYDDPLKDRSQIADLRGSLKERAEHIMVVDLERNDLGQVCEPGSVRVVELAKEQSFAHVHHLVSEVSGLLRPATSIFTVLRALFPGGSITGAPKLSAQRLICQLEDQARGPYTGSLGYIDRFGDASFNILIRTLLYQRSSTKILTQTGGGIVYDSKPAEEIEETKIKLRGLLW